MKNKVSILNRSQSRIPPHRKLRALLSNLLETSKIRDTTLELVFFNDEQIRSYYLKYFGEDRPTDVIAFPLEEKTMLGSIVISVDTARRQAQEHRQSFWNEVRFLIIHGFLHLVGHDHAKEDEGRIMKEMEETLMERTVNI